MKISIYLCLVALLLFGCATSSPIRRASESKSEFGTPPELVKHSYPPSDIYRIYHRAATGFVSVQSIRQAAEQRAEDFAKRQGKSFVVLGERISQPPYILGNFPRIEIGFALIDKSETPKKSEPNDRYADLEQLKKLLDSGALTEDEFQKEKARACRELFLCALQVTCALPLVWTTNEKHIRVT